MTKKSLQKEVNEIKEDVRSLKEKESDIQVFVVQSLEQEQKLCQEFGNKKDKKGKVILIRCY